MLRLGFRREETRQQPRISDRAVHPEPVARQPAPGRGDSQPGGIDWGSSSYEAAAPDADVGWRVDDQEMLENATHRDELALRDFGPDHGVLSEQSDDERTEFVTEVGLCRCILRPPPVKADRRVLSKRLRRIKVHEGTSVIAR
jgi:hypothetical protein